MRKSAEHLLVLADVQQALQNVLLAFPGFQSVWCCHICSEKHVHMLSGLHTGGLQRAQVSRAHLLVLADVQQALQDVLLAQLGEAHNGAARLDGLDDLAAGVAGQREARGAAVDLHRPAQRLLRATCHAARTQVARDSAAL